MFGTQIDDPVTMTTPLKADPVVTGAKIYGLQIGEILWHPVDSPGASRFKVVDSCFTIILTPNPAHLRHSNVVKEGAQLINLAVDESR